MIQKIENIEQIFDFYEYFIRNRKKTIKQIKIHHTFCLKLFPADCIRIPLKAGKYCTNQTSK